MYGYLMEGKMPKQRRSEPRFINWAYGSMVVNSVKDFFTLYVEKDKNEHHRFSPELQRC